MGQVVNLNRARKSRARAEKRRKADENAVRHGLSKAERTRQQAEAARDARRLDGHVLDSDTPGDGGGTDG
ncbi:DUF4169 family protein [Oceanomicrobium pacificus]|uniref:DUF4169 family protein n=1 Tax=Oceanomicrobium pacificus TaxID=2692916 RepID=A0A6B0TXC2_9RHOB|nr:DUF4169 family protein [Oceanomicrobium pacificus]MXU66355.1 DUF4169 family protein [Oceanomicrobium pacificus]